MAYNSKINWKPKHPPTEIKQVHAVDTTQLHSTEAAEAGECGGEEHGS